jgi:hypothetical protein
VVCVWSHEASEELVGAFARIQRCFGEANSLARNIVERFIGAAILLTATVWGANLDDWLGWSKFSMDAGRLDVQDPTRRSGMMVSSAMLSP